MNPVITTALAAAAVCWMLSAIFTLVELRAQRSGSPRLPIGRVLAALGALCLAALMAWLWSTQQRPPIRTLGETRLWYATLLPLIGLAVEWRLRAAELRLPMIGFGLLFVGISLANPGALDRTLMPALQSRWFVPHVTVYLASYAALSLSCGAALLALWRIRREHRSATAEDLRLPMLLLRIGIPFLTLGLLFGALWAKQAWGHYWSWDPKETWAFLTWATYVAILHAAPEGRLSPMRRLVLVASAFAVVLGCWFLVNYLPAASASVHTYAMPG